MSFLSLQVYKVLITNFTWGLFILGMKYGKVMPK